MYKYSVYVACLLIFLFPVFLNAQDTSQAKSSKIFQPYPISVSVFSNASALPNNPGQIFARIHPGITAGTSFRYNSSQKHQLAQTVKLGFFYHRFVQGAIQLYTEVAYRYELKNGLGFDLLGGGGYVHSFADTEILELNSDGVYVRKTNYGKPEFMGSIAVGAGYKFQQWKRNSARVFVNYQFWLQAPFIKQYVPVLPNTALHIGITYPLINNKNPKRVQYRSGPDI